MKSKEFTVEILGLPDLEGIFGTESDVFFEALLLRIAQLCGKTE